MKKFLIILLGLALGIVIAVLIRSPQVFSDDQHIQSTQFTVATLLAYTGAALSAVVYAVTRRLWALLIGVTMLTIALVWSI